MYDFTLPDYKGNSIVNLMSSISRNFGQHHSYRELKVLPSKDLQGFKNIILLVIDGLGFNFLQRQKGSFLQRNIRSSITSTFLSTTACANTAFHTGYPPQQHALTGWDVNLKEVGAITTVLPFVTMFGSDPLSEYGFRMDQILDIKSFHKGLKAKCFTIIDRHIAFSPFTTFVSQDSEIIPASGYKNVFTKLRTLVKRRSSRRRFFHAYIPELDAVAHKKGINSHEVREFFSEIDKRVKRLASSLEGTNTKLIVVADHGFIDTSSKSVVWVEKIPGLKECLTIPLAGEARVRHAFVRPHKVRDFERIVRKRLSRFCWCFKGEQLIKDHLFGLGKPNRKLFDRVGDYVLIMKKNFILKDRLANSVSDSFLKGNHGGVSDDEMFVPLVVIDC